MKAIFFTSAIFFLTVIGLNAQNLIAVQNAGTPSFFLKIADAIESAQDGDTIYLPGGSFGECTINKRLHLVGVGHHPDSTKATLMTYIPGVSFDPGSDGSTLTGIRTINLSIGNNIDEIKNLIISRCYIGNCYIYLKCSNITFVQNIIKTVGGSDNRDISFSNNKIGSLGGFEYCSIRNNIILYISYSITLSVFENNFIGSTYSSYYLQSNIINNNISYSGFDITTQNVGANNLFYQEAGSIFVKEDSDFEYGNDYHLKSGCEGKNAGKDGTDMGIYGGTFPWKEGSLPFNPHYQRINISPTTDNNGNLNVNIKVAAQEH
jgi:hypothetical protein